MDRSFQGRDGNVPRSKPEHVISSAPMRELVCGHRPEVSDRTRRAAESLKYRDSDRHADSERKRNKFATIWIYIHDPPRQVGRVQNFKSLVARNGADPEKAATASNIFASKGRPLGIKDED